MLQRRTLLASTAALITRPAIAQPARAGTLRFVPQAPLAVLDPGYTVANVTRTHAALVFDTLFAVDSTLRPRPQMAEGHEVSADGRTWTVRLRPGLRFHDGTPVRAADCAASMRRWAGVDTLGRLAGTVVDSWDAPDDRTMSVRLKRPFPFLLDAMASPTGNTPIILPERLAAIAPGRQGLEMVGSGPFRFLPDEFNAGSRAAYARFAEYQPRAEPPSWNSGGKTAFFDRIEWIGMPDPATAAAALQAGEVDWWEQALADLLPVLKRDRNIALDRADPTGYLAIMRFNALQPPFDKPLMRRAMLHAVDQTDYMAAVTNGDPDAYRTCHSLFPCGTAYGVPATPDPMREPPDLDRARALIREAGYNGERIVILSPTDFPSISPFGQITFETMRRLGLNAELVETDWGSILSRRNNRGLVSAGGWSVFHTWNSGGSLFDPVRNTTIRGQGDAGSAGWYASAPMEALVQDWLGADTEAERRRIAARMQDLAALDAPTVPVGQFFIAAAYRRTLSGITPSPTPVPWGVRRSA